MPESVSPKGGVVFPLILFSFVSLFLGIGAEVLGVFEGLTEELRGRWQAEGVEIRSEMGLPGLVGVLVTAAACFGVIAAIFGSPGGGRRCLLGVSFLFLSVTLAPAFVVWGIFWKPFGVVLAVLWSWFSAMIYAQTHVMPCDEVGEVLVDRVVGLDEAEVNKQVTERSDVKS